MTNDAHEALCQALDDDEAHVDGDVQTHTPEQLATLLQGLVHDEFWYMMLAGKFVSST